MHSSDDVLKGYPIPFIAFLAAERLVFGPDMHLAFVKLDPDLEFAAIETKVATIRKAWVMPLCVVLGHLK